MGALVTVAEVKAFMPIRPNDTTYDATLTKIIASVTAQIESACRRTFTSEPRVEIFDIQQGADIIYDITGLSQDGLVDTVPGAFRVSNVPVDETQPFQVYYDPYRRFGADTLIDASAVVLFADRGLFYVAAPLRAGRDLLKVVYSGGPDIDDALKLACIEQCLYEYKRMQFEQAGSDSQNNDDGAKAPWANKAGLLPRVISAIGPYRKLLRGRG